MEWKKIKEDKDKLVDALRETGSQSELARNLNISRPTVRYYVKDKHEISLSEYHQYEGSREGKEEQKPDVEEIREGYYVVHAPHKDIEISEDTLREFKKYYCHPEGRNTMTYCQRKLDIPRKDLWAIKTAFSITHDDVEFTDKQIENRDPEDLSEVSLERRKEIIDKKINQKFREADKKELKKYRKKNFFYNKLIEGMKSNVNSMNFTPPRVKYKSSKNRIHTIAINLADWHVGKNVLGSQLLSGEGDYNLKTFEKSKKKMIEECIYLLEREKPENVYILNYGDGADDPTSETYENQVLNQDIWVEEQLMKYVDVLKDFIMSIYDRSGGVEYAAVPGNHSNKMNWDMVAAMFLKRLFSDYEEIKVDDRKKPDKIHKMGELYLVQTHGKNIRRGTYTRQTDLLNMLRIAKIPPRKALICQGHEHHKEELEGTGYKWKMLPSMVGGDGLAENKIRTTSRPAQTLYLINDEGLKDEYNVYFDE